ncbi:hypothetical protein ACFO3D_14365 [Virgibacillus kekensis]|uniref:Uncharacterized protein n=1 Tax=Virgibacillus kekensis TaxID=202261 RepID=A0ABV9DP88_9BACI
MLDNAEKEFNIDKSRGMRYGLLPQRFAEEKGDKIKGLNQQAQKYEGNLNAFHESEKHSKIALEVQKEIVHQEFSEIYSEYSHVTEEYNTLITDLKHEYVQEYLKTDVKHEQIEEFENPELFKHYTSERANDIELKKDWEDNQHSLLIANRSVAKWSKEYSGIYSSGSTRDKIYDTRLKLEIAKYQVNQRENEKGVLNGRVNESLSSKYQNQPSTLIEQTPTKLKARLLELHLENRSTGVLSKDLKLVEKDLAREGKDISHLYDKEFVQAGANIGGIAKLFDNLGNQSHDRDKDYDKIKRKSKSKMKERTLGKNNELEME